ncbi:hypothetical protein MMC10_010423 [Thelotrema lepadinum]|nr:hypothetical protein [Thelotrema lepadinum]
MADDQNVPLLKWSAQFKVTTRESSARSLQGDKILLPPSALEQLLSAATVTVVTKDAPSTPFDPFRSQIFRNDAGRSRVADRHQNLPHPLTFRLVNPSNGNIVYAGIREFTAEEEEVAISEFLRHMLGLDQDKDEEMLTVHVVTLPKGTYARLRPLEAGYDADWKPLLERYLRNTFTTLTKDEILSVPSGSTDYKFLVDKFTPDGEAICIVDTDLEIDIEALNEEQARETLKRRLATSAGADSQGGELAIGKEHSGTVSQGGYVDFSLKRWDRSLSLTFELTSSGECELLLNPLTSRQRHRPRIDEHVFADLYNSPRRIKLQSTNSELDGSEELFISVYCWKSENQEGTSVPFSLKVSSDALPLSPSAEKVHSPGETQCKNCLQWVPGRSLVLHENFCYRNNVLCPECKQVFQKSSSEWKDHWHCPDDDVHGNSPQSHQKHDDLLHVLRSCPACSYQTKSTMQLARHRTSTCPAKIILCQFCHLLVPQQGPEDLDPNDLEVILSGLTPHELSDGSRTTECHMCSKIVRLRDMTVHLRHHDMERLTRTVPRLCRNMNCGRTLDGVGPMGAIARKRQDNDISLCSICYGPLYNSAYDPDNKALKRRAERKYLTQFLTGCGNDFCRNEFCKTARQYLGLEQISSKDATQLFRPDVEGLSTNVALHFCTDEPSQKRRILAEMLAAEQEDTGYDLPWTVAALEAEHNDLQKGRVWLESWAPKRSEMR